MKHNILCTDGFAGCGLDEMKKHNSLEVVFEKSLSHEDLLRKIPEFEGLIVRSASKVSRDVIGAGKNLKIIVRAGVGLDNIDAKAASERDIKVLNTPAGNTVSTAEMAFAMMLSLARHIPQAANMMNAGAWEKKKFMGTQLAGKTLGIVGLGRVGREVAKRAIAFGMCVIANDPIVADDQFASLNLKRSSLNDLCTNSDFITIHAALTHETQNLISARELKMMKKTAKIINCARGGIVNEIDLAAALREGTIAGAALDVFTEEPWTKEIFKDLTNVILTPHLGASTNEAQDAVAIEAAQAVVEFFGR